MQQQKKEKKNLSQRYQNPFDILGSESEEEVCEEVREEVPKEQTPSVRIWSKDAEDSLANRFVMKESTIQSLFQSPFQKGGVKGVNRNKKHRFSRPCFQNEDEGWVSIHCRRDQEEQSAEQPLTDEQIPEQTAQVETSQTAQMWAERVKESLEKAEEMRVKSKENSTERIADIRNSLSRLSFFRRPMVCETDRVEPST